MTTSNTGLILRIVFPYILLAGLWIFASDKVLEMLPLDTKTISHYSTYKGMVFVALTALLLVVVLQKELRVRMQSENALQRSEARLRLIGDNLPDSYVYQYTHGDGNPRFLYLSSGVERLHGVRAADALRDADLLVRQVLPEWAPSFRKAEADSRQKLSDFEIELPVCRSDGECRWLMMRAHPHLSDDGYPIWDGVVTDVTAHKHAEEAVKELNNLLEKRVAERTAELAVAKDLAETADRLKSVFLATMSHELRTPLNSIIGFTGIMLQGLAGPLTPEQNKQLRMVRESSHHLLALINDVLDLSKIEAGQMTIRAETFDLRTSIAKVTEIVRPLAEKKGLALTSHCPDEPHLIHNDARRIEQILLNLLNNAVKFTEAGSVTLSVKFETRFIRVSVTDTGIGIGPEDFGTLFQPFRQIDAGLTRQHEGTGLGLTICKRLANMLGGEIRVESVWGKGSTFILTIPITHEEATA